MSTTARKTGLKANDFNTIFNQLMLNSKDSLWIDMTDRTPYKMRKNGFSLIHKKDCKKESFETD